MCDACGYSDHFGEKRSPRVSMWTMSDPRWLTTEQRAEIATWMEHERIGDYARTRARRLLAHATLADKRLKAATDALAAIKTELEDANRRLKALEPRLVEMRVAEDILPERDARIQTLEAALKAYMFLEQTDGGRNPYKEGTNRYLALEKARAAIGAKP